MMTREELRQNLEWLAIASYNNKLEDMEIRTCVIMAEFDRLVAEIDRLTAEHGED